jgi:multidrug efflux pump subunit AcrA (membrane-fusion protein)
MLHNMMARLSIETTAARKRLAVPRSAVVREGIRSYVFVQTDDGTFERRLVELGISNDLFVEVTRGLSVGDLTAIAGASALQTGYAALK